MKIRLAQIIPRIRLWQLFSLCVVGSLVAPPRACALDPNRRVSQYGHTIWRTQDGAITPEPFFAQTGDGYIWVLHGGEFFRFDGTQFNKWIPPKGWVRPSRSITSLYGARDGSLWIAGSGSLSRIKDGKITTLTKPTERIGIGRILEDASGKIWVTRYRVPDGQGALCEVIADTLHCYGPSAGVPATHAHGIAEDRDGNFWFTGDQLYRWKPGTKAMQYLDGTKHPPLTAVMVDRSGAVWAAMDDVGPQFGLRYCRNGVCGEYATKGFHSSTVRATTLLTDKDGAVWIGTENDGLYRVSTGGVEHFSKAEGLSGRIISQILEDHEGNIWVATERGMDMFRNLAAKNYSADEGLSSGTASIVSVSNKGVVWVGTYEGEELNTKRSADILRPGPDRRFEPGPKLPGKIESLFQDHTGATWLGLNHEVAVYQNGKVEKILDRDGRVLHFDSTSAIIEDSSGVILVLSETHLFRIKDRHALEAIALPEKIRNLGFLLPNPSGGTLIHASPKLWLYKNGRIDRFPLPDLEKAPDIYQIIADTADPILLATNAGLFRWDGSGWHVFDQSNGLTCQRLMSFIKDQSGSLWMQSTCGLVKVEASELERWRRKEGQPAVTLFDALDGVRTGRSFNIQPMMSIAPNGLVWYANGSTIQSIDPAQVYKNLVPPPVRVESLTADGKLYPMMERPHIAPNPRSLEIDYTALSFTVPQRVQFRYRLEGHDQTWQGPITRRQAFYTDLRPGTYRFHVTACNNSGVWNDVGAVAEFVIDPTFYQMLWFKLLVACALVALLWTLYMLRLRQATANVQRRLLTQMEERERIARELHDTLLQGFQGIALRVQGVTTRMPKEDPLREMMENVLDRADEVMLDGRQRVRGLRQRTAHESELPARLTKCGQDLAEGHIASFSLTVVGTPAVLESTVLEEAYRISAEAITNAFRHASASRIEVEITYASSGLRISVRDDGNGIDKSVLLNGHPGHWGLSGMRERASVMRAEFNIWSREAAGTEAELVIPAAIAYPRKLKSANKQKFSSQPAGPGHP